MERRNITENSSDDSLEVEKNRPQRERKAPIRLEYDQIGNPIQRRADMKSVWTSTDGNEIKCIDELFNITSNSWSI